MRINRGAFLFATVLVVTTIAGAQASRTAAGQTLNATSLSAPAEALLNGSAVWDQIPAHKISLNRTPPLYDTDEPAALEIPALDVRVARAGGKVLVQMSWVDPTQDTAALPEVPNSPPETRFRKLPTEADDRFFDAAAAMFPAKPGAMTPSLQMGDTDDPVQIYYWNAARGPMLMAAAGRGTTRRTGGSFAAHGAYERGRWTVALQLPDLPAGTPLAFAIWNGSQKDRDGRKYFSVWQVLK
jgi:hypothetical protein